MPQINRIRVNNVKYNFGTQVYDDFVMRFNGKNTIYDLANGGGKSLLMLLLMQNMLPNCTLDDKQPIEKLFRQGGGNTCIHSLVEWKLDSCYQKDGYKYMTTGFCARKGRGAEDDESGADETTGASVNASENVSSNGSQTASIEYFNYCIFYREFGDNDMKNLPLSINGERVTYNGLKSYLRNLEKNDFSVSVKIFDRKGDYQSFISNYGIYESAWEIVRGINKTEGHVRTYFETNYKTSRKVVEDLLIEEIIQKSFNNRLSVDNDEGKMAQTLMDIKDKLVELSKKQSEISAYDSQMAAIDNFREYVGSYKDLYERKGNIEKLLFDMLLASKSEVVKAQKENDRLEALKEASQEKIAQENKLIAIAEVIAQKKSMESVKALVDESEDKRKKALENIERLQNRLTLMEAAVDYKDYTEYEKAYNEASYAVSNFGRENSELKNEMMLLAEMYHAIYEVREKSLASDESDKQGRAAALKEETIRLKDSLREADKKAASDKGIREYTEKELDKEEQKLEQLLSQYGILISETAVGEYEETVSNKKDLDREYAVLTDEKENYRKQLFNLNGEEASSEICITMLGNQIEALEKQVSEDNPDAKRIDSIKNIYGLSPNDGLSDKILETYSGMDREYNEADKNADVLSRFIENAQNGTYVCADPLRDKLKNYLISQYGDDVVEGHEWFAALNPGQKRDVLKRTPFVEYGFIIKNDFERIKQDNALANFERGGCVYPVISEQVLYDTKLEINKELIVFALKDMSFLRDDARLEAELRLAKDELESINIKLDKLRDRKQLVWDDYIFTIKYISAHNESDTQKSIGILKQEKENEQSKLQICKDKIARLQLLIRDNEEKLVISEKQRVQTEEKLKQYQDVINADRNISALRKSLAEYKEAEKASANEAADLENRLAKSEEELNEAADMAVAAFNVHKKLKDTWESEFAPYYSTENSFDENVYKKYENDSAEELEVKFLGLKEAFENKNGDYKDKQALMNHLKISMEKCRQNIIYKGLDFDETAAKVNDSGAGLDDGKKLMEVKDELVRFKKANENNDAEYEAQSALLNRLEGSVTHGISQIEERFGTFEEFECDNPETFRKQHKELVKELSLGLKKQDEDIKKAKQALSDAQVRSRDLERIVANAGMQLPEAMPEEDLNKLVNVNLEEYEAVQKEYASINKLEYKKSDEFARKKQQLIDLLVGFEAKDLAQEIRLSLNMPENIGQTEQMMKSLEETNTFIALEKSRVSKGIEDMERIKDNFENRCIQTCSNIKTELDRLPKLSGITLDGENISIISLNIPYVKEEMYKERMSSYIDETVMIAESFKDMSERLKYIRNRLMWKRLFSVIVTDMNAIRINLYKRERIKDQSRYLRYEEAVGSTGQSQGIYIQFLIAIINYISNMNTASKDAGVVGKTIFIDNPFGAAKDIYIWEPIFKLLATNHVQLIVPARGATPAIVGRFDVNYILGQKMAGKRQQTVVVDYYSNVKEEQMEYTRMDYEQASFDFL